MKHVPSVCKGMAALLGAYLFLFPHIAGAQNTAGARNGHSALLDSLITELDATASLHLSHSYIQSPSHSLAATEQLFLYVKKDTTSRYSDERAILEAEKQVLRGDVGFSLEAGYLENFEAGLFGEQGIFYKRRAKAGLEWDILKNGLLENRYDLQKLEREKQALRSESANMNASAPDSYFHTLQNRISHTFTRRKAEVLQNYLDLLSKQEEILITLYHNNYRTWDEVLKITSEKARIRRLLESAETLNAQFAAKGLRAADVAELPVPAINLPMLEQAAAGQNRPADPLEHQVIDRHHPLTDISLSASMDYNFYSNAPEEQFTGRTGQREFLSASINLSIPLPMQIKEKNDLVEAKRRRQESRLASRTDKGYPKVYKMYEEYQAILSEYERDRQSMVLHDREIQNLLTKQKLRDPVYSPQKLLHVLDNRYNKELELLGNHRELYEKLLEIYEYTNQTPVQRYTTPVIYDTDDNENEGRPETKNNDSVKQNKADMHERNNDSADLNKAAVPEPDYDSADQNKADAPQLDYRRNIYIWSPTFEKYKNKALAEYLEAEGFTTVFLSPGVNPDMQKFRTFAKQARSRGIRVEWMVGDNNLLFKERREELLAKIRRASAAGADGIHLDVEPQTFKDWDEKKEQYQQLYVAMAREASQAARKAGLALSLSVPVYFDSIMRPLKDTADSIHLMAYGSGDAAKIKERTAEERKIASGKTTIALRPGDFSNYGTFKSSMEQMKAEGIADRFSVQDLEAYLKSKGNISGLLMKI